METSEVMPDDHHNYSISAVSQAGVIPRLRLR